MLVMGIESSCDETAVAIVEKKKKNKGKIIKEIIYSQVEKHMPFGRCGIELCRKW